MKAQSSIEYLIVVGFALAILTPLFYLSLTYSSDSFMVSQASQAVESVAKAVDYVYTLGPNSKASVTVFLPHSINRTLVGNRTILVIVSTSAGNADAFANVKANVSGSLPRLQGRYLVTVNYTDQGFVNVSAG